MALVVVVVALFAGAAAQLVGPGGMVEYSGGGGARRGWGTVSEPAAGFFVAGSTLKALNGVYAREHPERVDRVCNRRACQLAYVNHASGWTLALAEPPDGYDATGGRSTEWVFVDRKGRDAFGHRGETVLPGSGDDWRHLGRGGDLGDRDERASVAAGGEDDWSQLPWQVIYIGDPDMVNQLRRRPASTDSTAVRAETSVKTKRKVDTVGVGRRRRRYHEHVNDAALRGSYVDDYGALRSLAAPDGGDAPDAPRMAAPPDVAVGAAAALGEGALAARDEGRFAECADLWAPHVGDERPWWQRRGDAEADRWVAAVAALRAAACARRARGSICFGI